MHYINSSPRVSNLGGRTHIGIIHPSQFTRLLKHTLPRLSPAQAKHEPPRVGYSILACPALTSNARSLAMNVTEHFPLQLYPNHCRSDTGAPAGKNLAQEKQATRRIGTF